MKYPVFLTLWLMAGCGTQPSTQEAETSVPGEPERVELLAPRAQLTRLSVDLRGVHPTQEELTYFEENPASWPGYVEEYLADPRFLERVREIYNQRILTRNGMTYFDADEAGFSQVDRGALADRIGDEALMLLTHIVENDLPFSEMVTADYTMADPMLAEMWDIDIPEGSKGWVEGHYTDGRPHAGILTMTGIWQKYPSMGGNANRHRANAVSIMMLCDDYLSRPIVLNRAAVDLLTVDPENAIATTQSCQSCHSTLDPLSAHFFGFFNYDAEDGIEQTVYRPENESNWRYYSGKEPGYYGRPTANIVELAEEIAEDNRFSDCAVKTFWEGLTQRTEVDEDWGEFEPHRDAFVESGLNVKALIRSIVMSDEYRAAHGREAGLDDRLAGAKVLSPAQLASVIEGKTGYRWEFGGRDGLTRNDMGLPVLAGGIDSEFVTKPSYVPSVGLMFVQERLAQAAAYHVAERDLSPERQGKARLLRYVNINDTPDSNPEAFKAQIESLYLDITGEALPEGATEADDLVNLWKYLHSVEASPKMAWAGVVSVVLRDPRILFY